jgi:hypothetical protein
MAPLDLVKALQERKLSRKLSKSVKGRKRKDTLSDLDRGLNAALERRTRETPQDRQRVFGRATKTVRRPGQSPSQGSESAQGQK